MFSFFAKIEVAPTEEERGRDSGQVRDVANCMDMEPSKSLTIAPECLSIYLLLAFPYADYLCGRREFVRVRNVFNYLIFSCYLLFVESFFFLKNSNNKLKLKKK